MDRGQEKAASRINRAFVKALRPHSRQKRGAVAWLQFRTGGVAIDRFHWVGFIRGLLQLAPALGENRRFSNA